ncbi:MAG TPA: CHASE2 domain-containing protein, partial [Chroococcales cyanobacterium]
ARRLGVKDRRAIPRSAYANLMKVLQKAGARVIALDVPLGELANEGKAPVSGARTSDGLLLDAGDSALVEALKNSKNVVLSSNVDLKAQSRDGVYRLPSMPFVEALGLDSGSVGNALILPDGDGSVRHMSLSFDQFSPSAFLCKSFALRIAEKQLDAKALADGPDRLFLRKHVFPSRIRINFVGPSRTFRMAPLWRALDWKTHQARNGLFYPSADRSARGDDQTAPADQESSPFAGKIVLVGLVDNAAESKAPVGAETGDSQSMPESFPSPVSGRNGPMSAIELQANSISNILHDRFLNEPEAWKFALIAFLLAAMLGRLLAVFRSRPALSLLGLAAFAIIWLAGAYMAFVSLHILVPVVVPILAVAVPCWLLVIVDSETFVRRERRRRTRVFRYLAAKPLAQEIERRLLAELGLDGKRMTVTVVACQLRDFLGNRADEPPEATMERLNASLSVMMNCIGEHHGFVERIWNCGVIGIWGAPIAMPEDKQAKLATDCALAIRKRLFNLYDGKEANAGANFNFTCGISTGESVCGTINAIAKDTNLTQYGAIGPAVDLAVELESLNPSYGTAFMLSETTASLVGQMFEVREIDRVRLNQREGMQP